MCSNMLSKTLWCNFTNLVATCYCTVDIRKKNFIVIIVRKYLKFIILIRIQNGIVDKSSDRCYKGHEFQTPWMWF